MSLSPPGNIYEEWKVATLVCVRPKNTNHQWKSVHWSSRIQFDMRYPTLVVSRVHTTYSTLQQSRSTDMYVLRKLRATYPFAFRNSHLSTLLQKIAPPSGHILLLLLNSTANEAWVCINCTETYNVYWRQKVGMHSAESRALCLNRFFT